MNELSIVSEKTRLATIAKLLPRFAQSRDRNKNELTNWPSALGILRTSEVNVEFLKSLDLIVERNIMCSIFITKEDDATIEMTEMHGVALFRLEEKVIWPDKVSEMMSDMRGMNLVLLSQIDPDTDYAFFAGRVAKTIRTKYKSITERYE